MSQVSATETTLSSVSKETAIEKTPVLIVGGGPVGLTLAAQLGMRGVDNILVSKNMQTSTHPKCNLANARSMEHFRRLGISDALRDVGLPSEHPQDVVYFTRLAKEEIARIDIPSSSESMTLSHQQGTHWPTPEPPYRVSQIFIEQVLKNKAESNAASSVRFGWELLDFQDREEYVSATVQHVESGERKEIQAAWLVGCDGGAGIVRTKLGIDYEGDGGAKRAFMGGTMLAAYYSSPDLAKVLEHHRPGHMLWTYNDDLVAATVRINGTDTFLTHIQLPAGSDADDFDPHEYIPLIVGEPVRVKILSMSPWNAGLRLVASTYKKGRCLLAGDAAHLFTPTGGFGMNTGIDDAANLSWKLAAVINGWGGANLVDSYSKERQPIGVRNTSAAKQIADIMGDVKIPENIEAQGATAAAARDQLAASLKRLARYEFDTVGVQLGVRYSRSGIVVSNNDNELPDEITEYIPSSQPGSRAPHVYLDGKTSLYDLLGMEFTLLCFDTHLNNGDLKDADRLLSAAAALGMPIKLQQIDDQAAAKLYEKKLVLVRPDMHIAWRGDSVPSDIDSIEAILNKVRGA